MMSKIRKDPGRDRKQMGKGMRKGICLVVAVLVVALAGGCAGRKSRDHYIREDVDLNFIERVVVLPFENQTNERGTELRVRDIVMTQVLAMGLFDVVEKGIVDKTLKDEVVVVADGIDAMTYKRLGQLLNAQAILHGSVGQAEEVRSGTETFHDLGLNMRLIDAGTGMVLWQASGFTSGESFGRRVLGISGPDQYQLASDLVEDLLSTIPPREE